MTIIRHVLELLLNPFFICLFCLGGAIFLLWRRIHLHVARIVLLLVFFCLLIISTGWLPGYMTYKLESQYPIIDKVDTSVQWVVVLGGGQNPHDGMPANDLLTSASIKRLVGGVRLLAQLPQAKLIVSGGSNGTNQSEAALMAQLTTWFHIPRQRVVLEPLSINTSDQAKKLVSILHKQPFYLVTSAIHMPRSMKLFQQQGLNPIAAPTDFTFFWNDSSVEKMILPNGYNLAHFAIAWHEVLGRIWASMGWR